MRTVNKYTLSLAVLTVIGIVKAMPVDYLCRKGGPIYVEHPTDCEKFVQCRQDGSGEIQSCPFSTYWNQEFLTCFPAGQMACQSDKCANGPHGTIRKGHNNCRGFWECNNGKSEAKCCPLGKKFDDRLGCIDTVNKTDECKDTCLGVQYDWSNETANETVVCNKQAVDKEPEFYTELASGIVYKRRCAVGTVFDQAKCECDVAKKPVMKAACKREIYLPFTTDHRDMSDNPHFIDNEHVVVDNGVAYFNGVNSRLSIPFFNNKEHIDSIVIRINYTSASGKGVYPQVLVSNGGCRNVPSIVISESEINVKFQIGTTQNLMPSISILKPDIMPMEKIVEYKFLNETLIGTFNDVSSIMAADGFLRNVQCDLSIGGLPEYGNGQLKEMANFKGEINELSVYLCDPESTQ